MATWRTEAERHALQVQKRNMTPQQREAFSAAQEQRTKQQRYQSIYDDMKKNPQKYYDAFGGNVSQYNRELSYYEYMSGISSLNLPEQYTRYAYIYDDMRANKQKYLDAFGGSERAYNSELGRVRELFGIEADNAAPVIDFVSDRLTYAQMQQMGLDKFYQYDPTNADDMFLQQLGYAPSSFYTKSDLAKRQENGYSVNRYVTFDEDGNIDPRSFYLLNYGGGYDENNPEDVLNAALGLMPSAFGYKNTPEDQARQAAGLLPQAAEEYVANSEKFAAEYEEYQKNVQEYADAMYEWSSIPGIVRWLSAKPKDPYPDGAPETVQAVQQYYGKKMLPQAQTAYEKYTEDEKAVKAPNFYFEDGAPVIYSTDRKEYRDGTIDASFFQPSEEAILRQQIKDNPNKVGELYQEGRLTTEQVGAAISAGTKKEMATVAAEEVMYNDMIKQIKDQGLYDEYLKESENTKAALTSALQGEYSPENLAVLKENQDAAAAMIGMGFDWEGLIDEATAGIKNETKDKLKALGWNGEYQSDNPKIQKLLDEAAYGILQREYKNSEVLRKNMEKNPAWLNAIWTGMDNGVDNVKEAYATVLLKTMQATSWNVFDTKENNQAFRAGLGDMAEGLAENSQVRQAKNYEYIDAGTGSKKGTDAIYNITSTAVEMAIEMSLGAAIGKIGAGAAVSTETAAAAQSVSKFAKLAKKLIISKQMLPFFTASLGHNLMYGQLQGRTDLENWAAALPAAYFESVLEGAFGFFSTPNTAGALLKNGIQGMTKQTLINAGKAILSKTLGEALEENLQDITTTLIQNLMWRGNKAAVFDIDQMGQTTVTTLGVGLLLSLFGIPKGFHSYKNARNVETHFNMAVEAKEAGDLVAFEKYNKAMRKELNELMGNLEIDMEEGKIEKVMEYLQLQTDVAHAMDSMYSGVKDSVTLRQRKEAGEQIAQSDIDLADAQANSAITALRTFQGFDATYGTLLDQVRNNPGLTYMLQKGGFSAELIAENGEVLTPAQMETLARVEADSKKNPYIDAQFDDTTTAETLQGEVKKVNERLTTARAELNAFREQAKAKIAEAYKQGKQQGKAMTDAMTERGTRLKEGVAALEEEFTKAGQIASAFAYQQQTRGQFGVKPQAEQAEPEKPTVSKPVAAVIKRILEQGYDTLPQTENGKPRQIAPNFIYHTQYAGKPDIPDTAKHYNAQDMVIVSETQLDQAVVDQYELRLVYGSVIYDLKPQAATNPQETTNTAGAQTPAENQNAPTRGAQGFINDADVKIPALGDSGYIYSEQFQQERAARRELTFKNIIDEQKKKDARVSPGQQGLAGVAPENSDEVALYQRARDAVDKYRILRDQINEQTPEGEPAPGPSVKLSKLRVKAEAEVNRLMNKINITEVMNALKKSFVYDQDIQNDDFTAAHLQYRESIKANALDDADPIATFNALELSLDIIAKEAEQGAIEERAAQKHKDATVTNPNVVEQLAKPRDRAPSKLAQGLKGAASDVFGVGSENADQMSTDLGGNKKSEWTNTLWDRASDCYNKRSHYYLNDILYTYEFTDTLPKEFKRHMTKRASYQFKLENKDQSMSLSMSDIINIWGNMRAGNNILPGFKLLLNQEINEGEITSAELADIANVITGKNVSARTQEIIDAIGPENIANMRKVADFAWKFYNEKYYTNRYGERIEAPRARMDIMGYEVYGITRSRGNYWPTQTIHQHPSRGTISETEAKAPKRGFEHIKGQNEGKVVLSDILGMFDMHSYETAHAVAYGLYQRELYQMMYRYGLSEHVRTNKGEQYSRWLEEYRQNIFKPNERMSEMGRIARFLYNNVKLVKLVSPSVWFQQFAGIVHAGAYLDTKYYPLIKEFGKLDAEQEQIWREYMPSAALRAMGYSAKEEAEAAFTHAKVVGAAMKPLVTFDVITCKNVLKWAYNQVQGQQPNLKGEAFRQAVGELARHTIERTQGTYAPHTTSMFGTKTEFVARFLTMFTTQTNSQWNTMLGGFKDMGAKETRGRGMKKVNAVIMSSIAAWVISGIIGGGFRDWEEETTFNKIMNVASIFTGNIYLVRNIQGMFQYQNIDIPIVEQFQDIGEAWVSIANYKEKKTEAQAKYDETGDEKYLKSIRGYDGHIGGQIKNIAFAASALFGIPLKAFEKYAITRPLQTAADWGSEWAVETLDDYRGMWGFDLQPSANYDDFNKALLDGNYERAATYAKIIMEKGGNIDNYMNATTGGKGLTPEQQYRAAQIWNDAVIQMGLDERANGE